MFFSIALPIAVTAVGLILLVKLRFFFIVHPIVTARRLAESLSDRESRRALYLALAGTLGVGNIFGVCAGIIVGGAGCVFWIFFSSVFSMVIKYAECLLSLDTLTERGGGMHRVLSSLFCGRARILSPIYATLCIALALTMGSAMQSRALSDVAQTSLDISPLVATLLLAVLAFVGICGDGKKIEKITAIIIPLTTVIYILLALSVVFVHLRELPNVVKTIISEAFSFRAAGGGAISILSSRALREGYARGVLSNEAGVGTSSFAHIRSSARHPAQAGLSGMCEVLFDTPVLCTLTGIAVLCSSPPESAYASPMSLISYAVRTVLGRAGDVLLLVCVLAFAYSTVICWYYYGSECVRDLVGKKAKIPYFTVFLLFIFIGSLADAAPIVYLTDFIILLMSSMTLFAIIFASDRIVSLSREYGLIK